MNASKKPTRATPEGNAYLDLQALAKQSGRPVDEYLTRYALEGFLNRLSQSPRREVFVLKGGVLLAAFDQRRPTRDVDFAVIGLDNDVDNILSILREVAAADVGDGLDIDIGQAAAEVIREDSTGYTGVRVSFPAALASAKVNFNVDVNVGDPITPKPEVIAVPRILGGTIQILGYPVEMVIAEKLVTAIERGTANTRWCDLVDMYRLSNSRSMAGNVLIESCDTVATYRGATLVPLGAALEGFGEIAQARWFAWRNKQKLQAEAPENISELIRALEVFADPVLLRSAAGRLWNPSEREWQ